MNGMDSFWERRKESNEWALNVFQCAVNAYKNRKETKDMEKPVVVFDKDVTFTKEVIFERWCTPVFNGNVFFKGEVEMSVEVGKIYKCGDERVRIVHIEKTTNNGGLMYHFLYPDGAAFGKCVDRDGDITLGCSTGSWSPHNGEYSCRNPDKLRSFLKEIPNEIEMTVSEVSKIVGKTVKIVKEK